MTFTSTDKPAFCIIAPTPYLSLFARQSKTHLVLAHIVDTNPEYGNFYKQLSLNGHRIIMDNGAFELGESYKPSELLRLGEACGAHAIVLPDYPSQHHTKTIEAANEWKGPIKAAGYSTFFVPQSEVGDLDGWLRAYEWAAGDPDIDIIGMSILGIPNALPHIPAAYARVVMSQVIQDRNIQANKYHHYLGLNAGPALEIPALIRMGMLNSCDSSGPVWAGILGHEYTRNADSYQSVKKIKAHVDFDYPLTRDTATLDRIQHNLDLTLELFR